MNRAPHLYDATEVGRALTIASEMATAGIPIFVAKPAPGPDGNWNPLAGTGGSGYIVPTGWQHTPADPATLSTWRPGDALAAVQGTRTAVIDVDPRHGGDTAARQWEAAGLWPRSYGRASTPSGGWHDFVAPLGVRSRDAALPGVDIKCGDDDGNGRGFVWIAPTTKLSKTTGQLGRYAWVDELDLDALLDWDGTDDSGVFLAERIAELRTPAGAAVDAPHDTYDAMSSDARGIVARYIERIVADEQTTWAEIATWQDGVRDPTGRGWEKLAADLANRIGRLVRADWTPLDRINGERIYDSIVPPTVRAAVGDKWRTQWHRRTPAPMPAGLAETLANAAVDLGALIQKATPPCPTAPPATTNPNTTEHSTPNTSETSQPATSTPPTPPNASPTPTDAPPLPSQHSPTTSADPTSTDRLGPHGSTWWPIDLLPYLTGTVELEEAAFLTRTDGAAAWYAGRVNGIIGPSESGKTWVALLGVKQAADAEQRVTIIDLEDSPNSVANRLRALAISDDAVARYVRYLNPTDNPLDVLSVADLAEHLTTWAPQLVIVDGYNAGMTLAGLKLTDNHDATVYMQKLLMPIAATGACVVYIDHVPKSKEDESRGGIGAQAKRAMTSGCTLRVEVTQEFGRGQNGRLQLRVDKDRPGAVRGDSLPNARGAWWATVDIESTIFGIDIRIVEPNISNAREDASREPEDYRRVIVDYVASSSAPASKSNILKGVRGNNEAIVAAVDQLVADGHLIRQHGARSAQLHTIGRPFPTDQGSAPEELDEQPDNDPSRPFPPFPRARKGQEGSQGQIGSASRSLPTLPHPPTGGEGREGSLAPDEGQEGNETLNPNLTPRRVIERAVAGETVRVDLDTGEVLP